MDLSAIRRLGVIGAGQMGRGIAQVAAAGGYEVTLCDSTKALAEAGRAQIAAVVGKLVDKGKMASDAGEALLGRVHAAEGLNGLSGADLAIEAATENAE